MPLGFYFSPGYPLERPIGSFEEILVQLRRRQYVTVKLLCEQHVAIHGFGSYLGHLTGLELQERIVLGSTCLLVTGHPQSYYLPELTEKPCNIWEASGQTSSETD